VIVWLMAWLVPFFTPVMAVMFVVAGVFAWIRKARSGWLVRLLGEALRSDPNIDRKPYG
jgi:hypothetical protein